MFYVGQKIVCIKDFESFAFHGETFPKKGIIYTVRETFGNEAIRLVEIVNKPQRYIEGFSECRFLASRFSPLESYRESYSIAIQLVQELEQVDKQKVFNPKKETV